MDTTPRPADASLQASLRHLRRMAAGAALARALRGAAAGLAAPADAAAGGKDPEVPVVTDLAGSKDWEIPVVDDLTRKVNEYEGQHWLVVAGKDPEIPSTPGLAGRDPEIPVTSG